MLMDRVRIYSKSWFCASKYFDIIIIFQKIYQIDYLNNFWLYNNSLIDFRFRFVVISIIQKASFINF